MPARRCLAAILLLAAPAVAATPAAPSTPATRPANDPPTYKLKTAEQWIPAARDLNDATREEGLDALGAFVDRRPDLVPLPPDPPRRRCGRMRGASRDRGRRRRCGRSWI